jgi:hypothetical protein
MPVPWKKQGSVTTRRWRGNTTAVDVRRVELGHLHAAQRLAEGLVDLLTGEAAEEGVGVPVVLPGPDVAQMPADPDRVDVAEGRHTPAAARRRPLPGKHAQGLGQNGVKERLEAHRPRYGMARAKMHPGERESMV